MTDRSEKYLYDIQNAIELIEKFIPAEDRFEEYQKDLKTQSAVERQLAIIGESIKKFHHITEEKLSNAQKLVGFHKRLVNSYDSIDPSIVWAIVYRHLPSLKKEIEGMLN